MNEAVPIDVRLMDATAGALFWLAGLGLAAALAWWAVRHPAFALAGITVQGEVTHNSAATLRANVAPRITGNFFTADLQATRLAFEAVPWVRGATVQRQFPNRLRVWLAEHKPVAFWGPEGDSTLLSELGEVFEANTGEVEQDGLPRLAGPRAQAPQVLAMYRRLAPLFAPLDLSLEELVLTSRGSWQARLDTGATLELGRGSEAEVGERTERFARSLTQVTGRHGRRPEALVSADLRHEGGYALKLRGVTTEVAPRKN